MRDCYFCSYTVLCTAGFGDAIGQLPKFDIDKHGNRLDQPFDPYGKPKSLEKPFAASYRNVDRLLA